jgi:hypothetical protein
LISRKPKWLRNQRNLKSINPVELLGLALRKRLLLVIIAIITIFATVIAFEINAHMYLQVALHESSNLSVRGTITSIEHNYKTQGMVINSYHVFRLFIQLNINEVVWTNESYLVSGNDTVFGSKSINVGYDNLDSPQLVLGQEVECKGFYFGATDSPYSFVLTVAPSVRESYLKPQI